MIGLGGAGVNMVDQLVLENEGVRQLMVLDTEESSVRGSVVSEKMLIGAKMIRGMGTGGDPDLAQQLFRAEQDELRSMLKGTRLAVIVAGLGGGTGSGMLPGLVELLKDLGAAVVVVTALPFVFEGGRRRAQAGRALERVRSGADAVLCFSNESLAQLSEEHEDLRSGFGRMNTLLGRVALNLRQSVSERGLMQVSLADVRHLAHDTGVDGRDQLLCRAGHAEAEGANRVEDVVENLMASPLLQDERIWVRSHSLLACVTGGVDMSMSEFQSVMTYLRKQLPVEVPMVTSAHVDMGRKNSLALTLMVTGNWEELEENALKSNVGHVQEEQRPLFAAEGEGDSTQETGEPEMKLQVAKESESVMVEEEGWEEQSPAMSGEWEEKAMGSDEELEPELEGFASIRRESKEQVTERYFNRQEELPLDKKITRGRFEKSTPTMWDGQDLDQPTFMRQGLKIKL
ncbi:MAG: hypothetical protein HC904_13765 [Blastochloris sp.]|nr:hypothetical protein [Blastochloris sp.]